MTSTKPLLAVIIPLYNEELGVAQLLSRVENTLASLADYDYQLVLVNDGSHDRTWAQIQAAQQRNRRIVGINLSRNFGHQAALLAALEHTSADLFVIMDGDLQDPPEVIPRFLEQFKQGNDVVYARRASRQENVLLRLCYSVFYRLLASISAVQIPRDSGDFALMSNRVVRAILSSAETPKFLRGLRAWTGFKQVGIDVDRPERHAGDSKYTLGKLIRLALDGIFSFSVLPLKLVFLAGFAAIFLSTAFVAYVIYVRLVEGKGPSGFAATIIVITFLSGLQIIFLGTIGEYVGRIFEQGKRRPPYVIETILSDRINSLSTTREIVDIKVS